MLKRRRKMLMTPLKFTAEFDKSLKKKKQAFTK